MIAVLEQMNGLGVRVRPGVDEDEKVAFRRDRRGNASTLDTRQRPQFDRTGRDRRTRCDRR